MSPRPRPTFQVGRRTGHALDDLALEGLVGEQGQALVDGVLLAHEGLIVGHDCAHRVFDAGQVVVAEVAPPGSSKS